MQYNIDWSKVKKSPVPKVDDGCIMYFRGSGIKIGVLPTYICIMDSNNADEEIIGRKGHYTADMTTKEIKDLARAMINEANMEESAEEQVIIDATIQTMKDEQTGEEHEQVAELRKAVGNDKAVEKFLRSPSGAAAASRFVPSTRNVTYALLSGKIGRA